MTGRDLALAAESLAGTRFRLHGRDPAHGVDCIGLLAASLSIAGRPAEFPTGYPLRLTDVDCWLPSPGALGFAPATLPFRPGDVIMVRMSAVQVHLAIAGSNGNWVHAHAGLRQVVIAPDSPAGPVIHHWRLLPEN